MSSVLNAAEQILIDRLLSSEAPLMRKSKAGLCLFAAAGLLFLIGAGFVLYAGYLWLASLYSPQITALLSGLAMVLLSLIMWLAALAILQYKKRRLNKIRDEIQQTVETALELAQEELSEPVRENPKLAVTIASLAGYLTGRRIL